MAGRFFQVPGCAGRVARHVAVGSCLAAVLAVAGCNAAVGPAAAPGDGDIGGAAASAAASGAVGAGPVDKLRVCGQPVLHSPYRFDGYRGSRLASFRSGEHGLPTFGSADSDYPEVTAGYIVPPGDNRQISEATLEQARVLVYFEPGEHLNVTGIGPGNYSVFLGGYSPGPGEAAIDNGGQPGSTFLSAASHVTIEYLTIKNFNGGGQISTWGGSIVDQYGGYDWTVDYNTVGPNGNVLGNPNTGYGIGVGSDSEYEYNCVIENGEGGFNNGTATATIKDPAPWGGPADFTIEHNEIARNAIATCQPSWGGCPKGVWNDPDGVAAGIKVFGALNGTIDYNYVHGNYGSGIWPDTNNTGIDISYNYLSDNFAEAILYEASFNANITHNTVTGNGWNPQGTSEWAGYPEGFQTTDGGGPSFVDGAIAINSSGGSVGIQSGSTRYAGQLNITANYLVNNFGGIAAFQDRNRFCGEGADGGDGTCTVNGRYSGGNTTGSPYYVQPTSYSDEPATRAGSTSLTAAGGFQTNYDGSRTKPGPGWIIRAYNETNSDPLPGVFPPGETIASCTSNTTCTLTRPARVSITGGRLSGSPVEIEAGPPGGCGMYDLIGSSAGTQTGSPRNPYFDNCNWWIQDLTVSRNVFIMNANSTKTWKSGAVTSCTAANGCGYMVLYASTGSCTYGCLWSPYEYNVSAEYIISARARNIWSDNTYVWTGPGGWSFEAGSTSNVLTQRQWRSVPYRQDAGSTFGN